MILGIDLGSSFLKASLFDSDGRMLGTHAAPVVYAPGDGLRVEMPVDAVGDALRCALVETLSSAGLPAERLDAIAVSSQAQTFTVCGSDGRERIPFISWRDTRPERENRAAARLHDFGRHCSVSECLPCLTVAQLAFKNFPLRVQASDRMCFLPSWFAWRLTGRLAVDVNLAAMSGLYSLPAGDWWPEALSLCGMVAAQLPDLIPIGAIAGRTIAGNGFGMPSGIPVVLAGNDQTAGAYGAKIDRDGSVLVTLGTSQVVYACLHDMPSPSPGVMRGPYPGGLWYRLAADACGAGTVNWACSVLPGAGSPQAFDRLAAQAPDDAHGVRFVADGPAGSGRWAGQEDPAATVEDQARAVLVCLAERLADMFRCLEIHPKACVVRVAGGGSRSVPWVSLIEARLGAALTPCADADPARGAFRMAADAIK